jgi:hypothetical protein
MAHRGGSLRCSKSAGHEGEADILLVIPLAVPDLAAEQLKRILRRDILWRKTARRTGGMIARAPGTG